MPDGGWSFEWRRTWDEVFEPAFVDRWDSLRARAAIPSVYHIPAVVRAWAETCGAARGCDPLFGIGRRGEDEVLLPWVIDTTRGRLVSRRIVEGVGQDLFGYHDPIGPRMDARAWDELWAAARRATGDACHQVLLRSVDAAYAGCVREPAESAPVLALGGLASLDEALARCSANHRGEVNRRVRRLAERGDIGLRVFTPADRGQAGVAFEQLAEAYAARRETRPEYPSLDRPGLRELWRRAATDGVAEGWGHLALLTVGGAPVAWHLGLFDAGALYWWLPAHAREWEPLSPGKVLLAKLIEHGIEQRWRSLHFMAGAQPYKLAWRPDTPERRVLRWHSPSLAGSLLARYDKRPFRLKAEATLSNG